MAVMASSPGLRSAPQLKQARNPISLKQVDKVLSRSVAVGSLVFGAQTIGALMSQVKQASPLWATIVVSALCASFILALVLSIIGRFVRTAHGIVAGVYVVALLSWPFAVLHPHTDTDNYWLYFILTVGTSTAAIAFSTRAASVYLFLVPIAYGIIRITPPGGSASVPLAALDAIYAIILGGAVIVIITMLRQTAANVDVAQSTALERYGHAVRQHATEVERVQVDSIVHDSVLTTLISAARAYTPEAEELAAVMAGNAIGHLHDAALVQPDDGTTIRLRAIAKRIKDAAATMSPPFRVRSGDVGSRSIPMSAGEAVYSAAVQAMVNSVQHAGDSPEIERRVTMKGVRPGGIEVEISDTGRGFTLEAVPTERLGVRISIIERVTNSGGSVSIASAPNHGAVVTVRWPLDRNVATDALDESGALDETGEPDEPGESADLDSLGDTDALDTIGSGSPVDGEATK
jgi:Histidine kinase-, DNA gyrase B-, and HSP90-like ATPase